jgi:acyl-CoA synthetase (AMP-forming)/AMP-acid ligase II
LSSKRWRRGCHHHAGEGQTATEEAIIEEGREKLARFKLAKQAKFIDLLPHNAAGKIL